MKVLKPLSQKFIESDQVPDGRHAVGGVQGLYVEKKEGEIRKYILRLRSPSGETQISYAVVSVKKAKDFAQIDLAKARQGINPRAEREALKLEQKKQAEADRLREIEANATLESVTDAWMQHERQSYGRWKDSPRNELRERQRITKHIFEYKDFGSRPLSTFSAQEMAELFNELYAKSYGTAIKVLAHLRGVFNFARSSQKFGTVPDPFNADFLELTKGARRKYKSAVNNRAALPYADIPLFMDALLKKGDNVSLAIAFSILTATRGKAVRLAQWKEFNFNEAKWVIPIDHDKVGRPEDEWRTIFLSRQAIELLKLLPSKHDNGLVFPPLLARPLKHMNESAMSIHIKRMHKQKKFIDDIGWADPKTLDQNGDPKPITQHATARSSFKTWTRENFRKYDSLSVELCLLHEVDELYNKAYDRAEMEEHRREIMQDWADHCLQGINLKNHSFS